MQAERPNPLSVLKELVEAKDAKDQLGTLRSDTAYYNTSGDHAELDRRLSAAWSAARAMASAPPQGVMLTDEEMADALGFHAWPTSAMQQALDALEMAHAGLKWYRDSGSDAETDEVIQAAMQALRAALAQPSPALEGEGDELRDLRITPLQREGLKNLHDHLDCLAAVWEDRSRPKGERHYKDSAMDLQARYAREWLRSIEAEDVRRLFVSPAPAEKPSQDEKAVSAADMVALLRDPNFRMSGGSQFALEIVAALSLLVSVLQQGEQHG